MAGLQGIALEASLAKAKNDKNKLNNTNHMGIFDFFKSDDKNIDWDSIKTSNEVYPENSFSLVIAQSENEMPGTGWVNMAYVNYKYKKFCPYNLRFSIEFLEDEKESEKLDMGTIEDYFIDELKKGCVVHVVARVPADFGMVMDVYVDNDEFAEEALTKIYDDPKKLVEFGCDFEYDPKWKTYKEIIKLTS